MGAAQSRRSRTGDSITPEEYQSGLSTVPAGSTATKRQPRCWRAPPQVTRWQRGRKAEGQSRSTGQGETCP